MEEWAQRQEKAWFSGTKTIIEYEGRIRGKWTGKTKWKHEHEEDEKVTLQEVEHQHWWEAQGTCSNFTPSEITHGEKSIEVE